MNDMSNGQPAWQPILDYWFGQAFDDVGCANQKASLWWGLFADVLCSDGHLAECKPHQNPGQLV